MWDANCRAQHGPANSTKCTVVSGGEALLFNRCAIDGVELIRCIFTFNPLPLLCKTCEADCGLHARLLNFTLLLGLVACSGAATRPGALRKSPCRPFQGEVGKATPVRRRGEGPGTGLPPAPPLAASCTEVGALWPPPPFTEDASSSPLLRVPAVVLPLVPPAPPAWRRRQEAAMLARRASQASCGRLSAKAHTRLQK